jgi:hypothetical protein
VSRYGSARIELLGKLPILFLLAIRSFLSVVRRTAVALRSSFAGAAAVGACRCGPPLLRRLGGATRGPRRWGRDGPPIGGPSLILRADAAAAAAVAKRTAIATDAAVGLRQTLACATQRIFAASASIARAICGPRNRHLAAIRLSYAAAIETAGARRFVLATLATT